MRKVWILIPLLAIVLVACNDAYTKDEEIVERQQEIYSKSQPVPMFDYSLDRDILIQIYTAKNDVFATWTVITSQGTGQVLFTCPSVGYGIPADTQLTNPLQTYGSNGGVIEQPEPNGLYSSKNTDATYVLCTLENGQIAPLYTEQKVTVFPFAVEVINGEIVRVGEQSSVEIETKE